MGNTVWKSEKLICKAPLLRPGKKDVASAGAVVRACGESHGAEATQSRRLIEHRGAVR
jgi:hypothetical protein